jgi:hypothetical protein
VVLSSESYYKEKAKNLGAVGFIKKQISISALQDQIEQIFLKQGIRCVKEIN